MVLLITALGGIVTWVPLVRCPRGLGEGGAYQMILLLAAGVLLQGDGVAQLIEQLRSDKPEIRSAALVKLKALGNPAIPDLEKAALDRDPDVASAAKQVLRFIRVRGQLSPALLALAPAADERLATGPPSEWTKVFLEASAKGLKTLKREDLDPIVVAAVRGSSSTSERMQVLEQAVWWRLDAAAPEMVPLLEDPDDQVRAEAADYLARLGARSAAPSIRKLLKAESAHVRSGAAEALG